MRTSPIMGVNRQLLGYVALLMSILCQHLTFGLDLSVYETKSYSNPVGSSEFTRFVTHNVTGTVYVGASDALYQLREDFTRQQRVNTEVECLEDVIICPNYNKILLVDYAHYRLITCGSEDSFGDASEKRGTCQTRDLGNIGSILQENGNRVVASGKLTTEAIIAPGPENGGVDTLYVAATFENEEKHNAVRPVSRRSLNVSDDLLFTVERDAQLILYLSQFPGTDLIINYVSAFLWNNFIYFVTSQRRDVDSSGINVYVSKINRICHNQGAFSKSYAEILLECSISDTNYNLVQAVHVGPAGSTLAESLGINAGDDVLYGVFAKNEGEPLSSDVPISESALCVYKLQDIEEAFIDAIFGCLTGGPSFQLVYAFGSRCDTTKATRETAILQQCSALNWAIADGIEPLVSTAAIEWTDILPSSITTSTHRDHTVAFVGTANGELVKVHIESETQAREYERFDVGSPVLRDAEISADQEMVTILTQQTLVELRVENCLEYTSCEACIGVNGGLDGDPYCGWCTLENRCTRYDACPMPDVSTRWLSYNNAQCIGISNVTPNDRLPITVTKQQITLTVEELPDLKDGHSYQCIFDDSPPSDASKSGNELSCTTPAGADIPAIQSGSDHVIMQLRVFSTETQIKFVQRDFYFYECNMHNMCVACTNSSWACDWCIYSNVCTHDNGTCSEDDPSSIINGINNPEISPRQGYESCPQLSAQSGEILVSDGASKSISVTGINLPAEDRASDYKCILDIEGEESETEATRNGDVFTCGARMYTYDAVVQELPVGLSVLWNGVRVLDDVFGFKVTLYKCGVNRPDCSRCRSSLTTRSELNCGWCSGEDICTVEDSSDCSGGWKSSASTGNCPNPALVEVFPSSGPMEGNTIITISGTDLGKQFEDIASITVGGKECSTDGLGERYEAGSSVSCITLPGSVDSMEPIVVTVTGADGNQQKSMGEVLFTYRDPFITSFDPIEGFAAGGTMVTITGQYLDACSEISATIGSDCVIDRMDDVVNETNAMCRTTSSPVDSSHPLVVSFDGHTRQSQDSFTYRPNPTVSDVQPRKTIKSGGIAMTVTGTGFGLAQAPQIVMYIGDEQFKEKCNLHNATVIMCKTPDITTSSEDVSRKRREAAGEAKFGFIIGDVPDLLTWSDDNNVTLEYYNDPEYIPFEENPKRKSGDVETIMGMNLNVASFVRDVIVYIGSEAAETTSLGTSILTIKLPNKNPGPECINGNRTSDPCVVVYHGNLKFYIGTLRYLTEPPTIGPIIGIAVACLLLIIILAGVLLMYRRKVIGHKGDIEGLITEMNELENNIAGDIREAFVELQTDVTDLTSDLQGTGMPFVTHRQYAISMFFAGLETRPLTFDPEYPEEKIERAMLELSKLLNNKMFLMAFIQTLDEDKSVPNKDRLTIASLLTVLMILEDKLPYLTDVMMTLMASQVQDAIEEERPKKLFQRTELIVEKLLSNWIALSLYDFLKDHAAYPLFLLYKAIKCQCEKGPIDAINGRSHISLNDENIIGQRLVYEQVTLEVIVNDEDGEKKEVKVLDIDTISQVKGKILDSIHRNRAYSSRMQPWQVDLEWRHGNSGHLTLLDTDVSCEKENGWKKMNTLKHFSVTDGSKVTLIEKQDVANASVERKAVARHSNIVEGTALNGTSPHQMVMEDGLQLWHLVKDDSDETISNRKSTRQKKQIREIAFPRLLGTKGVVQEYMDDMFAAILNTADVPLGIKYIFDFFDGLAVRYNIEDDSVLHQWKSNILPLRFWQKVITNPQYIFDINQPRCVESSLRVISQAFYDAFRKNADQVSKDASYKKLLYTREIPQYRAMVENYYRSVTEMKRVGKSGLDGDLKETCHKFTGLFSRLSTLLELHKLLTKYKTKVMEALEDDEAYERAGLSDKLEEALGMMENGAAASFGSANNNQTDDTLEDE